MKKTRRQKVFCILACILLCASFFVFPLTVSAADDSEGKYYNSFIGYNNRFSAVSFGYRLDYSLSDAYSFIDNHTMPQIINDNLYHSEGSYDYDYQSYIVEDYFDPDAPGISFGVFTLAFSSDIVTLPLLEPPLDAAFIEDFSLRFFTENIIVDEVRFSIRPVEDGTDRILNPFMWSDPIKVSASNVLVSNFNVIYEYDSLFHFEDVSFDLGLLPPAGYVLCVDFGFRRSPNHGINFENFSINVDDTCYFDMYNYRKDDGFGPVPPSGGDIVIPPSDVIYNWDTSFLYNGVLMYNQTLDKFGDTKSSLSVLTNNFKTILPSFKTGLLNVSVLMTYLVDDLPFASFLITVSLLIGLISFMFNIAGSLVGAAASNSRRAAASNSRRAAASNSRRNTSNSKEGS